MRKSEWITHHRTRTKVLARVEVHPRKDCCQKEREQKVPHLLPKKEDTADVDLEVQDVRFAMYARDDKCEDATGKAACPSRSKMHVAFAGSWQNSQKRKSRYIAKNMPRASTRLTNKTLHCELSSTPTANATCEFWKFVRFSLFDLFSPLSRLYFLPHKTISTGIIFLYLCVF